MVKEGVTEYLNLKQLIDRSPIDSLSNGRFLVVINIVKPEANNVFTKSKTFIRLPDAIDEITTFKDNNNDILYFNSYVEDLDLKITVYEIEEDYRELDFNKLNIDIYQENSIEEKVNNIITNVQNKTFNNLNVEINEEKERRELSEINEILENILEEEKEEKILEDTRNISMGTTKCNNNPIEEFNFLNNQQLNNTIDETRVNVVQQFGGKTNITNDKQSMDIKSDIKEISQDNLNNYTSFGGNRRNLNNSQNIEVLNNKKVESDNEKKYYILVMRKIEIDTKEVKNINKKKINTSELCIVTDKLEQIHEIVKQQKEKMKQSITEEKKSISSHVKIIEMPKNKTILENKKEFHSQKTISSNKSSINSVSKNR